MLRKLSLALAVSCASNGMAWAAEAPLTTKTDLVSVYQEAVDNNADLAAARAQYGAQKEVVPQARAGLLPNLSAGADLNNTRTELDQPALTATRSATVYQATLSQPIFRADRWFQLQAAKSRQRTSLAATVGHRTEHDPAKRRELFQCAAQPGQPGLDQG